MQNRARINLKEDGTVTVTAPLVTGSAPDRTLTVEAVPFPPIVPPADLIGQPPSGIKPPLQNGAWLKGLSPRKARPFARTASGVPGLPIGMIEPVDPTAALAAAAALDDIIRNPAPRRPSLLARLLPSTATAFWMAVAAALALLLARAEGWL